MGEAAAEETQEMGTAHHRLLHPRQILEGEEEDLLDAHCLEVEEGIWWIPTLQKNPQSTTGTTHQEDPLGQTRVMPSRNDGLRPSWT